MWKAKIVNSEGKTLGYGLNILVSYRNKKVEGYVGKCEIWTGDVNNFNDFNFDFIIYGDNKPFIELTNVYLDNWFFEYKTKKIYAHKQKFVADSLIILEGNKE